MCPGENETGEEMENEDVSVGHPLHVPRMGKSLRHDLIFDCEDSMPPGLPP